MNYFFYSQVPISWEEVDVTPVRGLDGKVQIPQSAINSVNTNKVGLKGVATFSHSTPILFTSVGNHLLERGL